jgi:hypothetical protein
MSALWALGLSLLAATVAQQQQAIAATERVSVNSRLVQGNGYSNGPLLSPDGSLVVFWSVASNLVPHDRNRRADIFLRDRRSATTRRVIKGASLTTPAPFYFDGRLLGFTRYSDADHYFLRDLATGAIAQLDLGPEGRPVHLWLDDTPQLSEGASHFTFTVFDGDRNHIYVRDLIAGETELVDVSAGGAAADGDSRRPTLSADGRYVAFDSLASDLVADDRNTAADIFVRDRTVGVTTRVSFGAFGAEANGSSEHPAISSDGRYVAFESYASNVVADDSNAARDVFLHDRLSGVTRRISVGPGGLQADGDSFGPKFVGPRLVQFGSTAANLTPRDVNERFDTFLYDVDAQTTRPSGVVPALTRRPARRRATTPLVFSRDGLWVGFVDSESDYVPGDTNRRSDAFVYGPLAQPWRLGDGS